MTVRVDCASSVLPLRSPLESSAECCPGTPELEPFWYVGHRGLGTQEPKGQGRRILQSPPLKWLRKNLKGWTFGPKRRTYNVIIFINDDDNLKIRLVWSRSVDVIWFDLLEIISKKVSTFRHVFDLLQVVDDVGAFIMSLLLQSLHSLYRPIRIVLPDRLSRKRIYCNVCTYYLVIDLDVYILKVISRTYNFLQPPFSVTPEYLFILTHPITIIMVKGLHLIYSKRTQT